MDPPNTIPPQDAQPPSDIVSAQDDQPSPNTISSEDDQPSSNLKPFQNVHSTPRIPSPTVAGSSPTVKVEYVSTTSAEPIIQPTSSATAEQFPTVIIATGFPTPNTTTKTRQIESESTTTTTAPPGFISILSAESSQITILKTQSKPSSSTTPTTALFISDTSLLSSHTPSRSSHTPSRPSHTSPSTSATHFSTNSNPARISISQILPAVLVPLFGLVAILTAIFLIRRHRRRLREQKATESPLPFLSPTSYTPNLIRISEKQKALRSGPSNFICREAGNEGETRPREEGSAEVVGRSGAVPEPREQVFVLQAQLVDNGSHGSQAPPDYRSTV